MKNITRRIIGKLKKRRKPIEDNQISILNEYYGTKFKVTCNVEKFRVLRYGGEKEALDYFLDLSKNAKVIYDIGASVGLFAIIAAKAYPSAKVYAFEPDEETFKRLKENIALNKLKNVKAVQIACSDSKGVVELFTNGVNGFAPSLVKQEDREGAPKNSIKIPCDTLDNLISKNVMRVPDLIKIDIEGAEILCLKGSDKLLEGQFGKKPKDIFIEVHPVFLTQFNSDENEVINFLLNKGYKSFGNHRRDEQIHYHFKEA